ncbi:hypothetical protein CVT25_005480 [Psilocybe cyanescens]|uniref:Uncharacterized protein n=1 Tax=Psilocybe cyanescens TaxID=93625 RepID=A0A409XSB0_PSICY|nr:hypothetical protein CVT25_005480 [Psilocybe cyanescens]
MSGKVGRFIKSLSAGTFLYILGGSHTVCSYKLIIYGELAALSGGTGVATARGDDSCSESFRKSTSTIIPPKAEQLLIQFIFDPMSKRYMAIEFILPCVYANSILAIFNAKSRLKKQVEASAEFHLSRSIIFGDVGNNADTPNG